MKTRIPVILLALSLAACEPRQPQEVPAPPPSPDNPAPAPTPAAPADATPAPGKDPGSSPAAPAQPAPAAPSPTEPAPAPKPTASVPTPPPAIESMSVARPSAKMSVAVDLRYQFDGAVVDGQPATLHLAAIPRVAGNNFNVSVKPAPGLEISRGSLAAQKVDASGVYRQEVSVVRHATAPENLRVLVTMDMPEGTAFGFFTIPFDAGNAPAGNTAQKSDSVKQR